MGQKSSCIQNKHTFKDIGRTKNFSSSWNYFWLGATNIWYYKLIRCVNCHTERVVTHSGSSFDVLVPGKWEDSKPEYFKLNHKFVTGDEMLAYLKTGYPKRYTKWWTDEEVEEIRKAQRLKQDEEDREDSFYEKMREENKEYYRDRDEILKKHREKENRLQREIFRRAELKQEE